MTQVERAQSGINRTIFVTGASGLIGRFLSARLTADGHRVLALVRGAAGRAAELHPWLGAPGGCSARLFPLGRGLWPPSPRFLGASRVGLSQGGSNFPAGGVVESGVPARE